MSLILESDLKRDLYFLAGDSMRGREAGTIDELRASMWIADQMRGIGVQPAGEDGTMFQWFSLRRQRLSAASIVRIGDRSFTMWSEIAATGNAISDVAAPTVWAGDGSDTTIDVRGKIAIAQLVAPATMGRETSVNSPEYRRARRALQLQGPRFTARGAVGVIFVGNATADTAFEGIGNITARGSYALENPPARGRAGGAAGAAGAGGANRGGGGGTGRGNANTPAPVMLVRSTMLSEMRSLAGQQGVIRLHREIFSYPSVNIVGVVRGTDPVLREEYVLFSSHQDHDGVRYDVAGDAIWNGADDNGTTSVALLAIARAFVAKPGKRSAMFVYHGAEERGLHGSNYHANNPVVPRDKIVAVLNGDMLGRNHPDSASIMGVQPPHRNSPELVAMALEANDMTGKFKLDSIWDRPTHPEGWYFRSDHLPYARLNIPALFYSSNLHPDYHTPRDEPETINYPKLTRITQWMYMTGWLVANNPKRPAVDPAFRLER